MTDEELERLVLAWMVARGGCVTDDEMDSMAAILDEHLLSFERSTLEEARKVLGL